MYNKIENTLKEKGFYQTLENYCLPHNGNDECIEDVLEELFHTEGFTDNEFSIETDTLFSSCGYDTGYCAIAWIEDNQLHTYNFQWEVR